MKTLFCWLFKFITIFCHIQIQVQHPAAKSMIEISRTQDEEVGDGTTSVIILGECYLRIFRVSTVKSV